MIAKNILIEITQLHTINLVILLVFMSFVTDSIADTWPIDYGYNPPYAPGNWSKKYGRCCGNHQSPINIDQFNAREVHYSRIRFLYLTLPRNVQVHNNGHTVMLRQEKNMVLCVMGGPLKDSYQFEQLYFHWGKTDSKGSETLLNSQSFALEMHAVFYKLRYRSISNATKFTDGVAVFAYLFEVDDSQPNLSIDPLIDSLPKVKQVGSQITLSKSVILRSLIHPSEFSNDKKQDYFTYDGSLTTPPCSEVVTWVVFKHPFKISRSQIAAFRDLNSVEGGKLEHNFRPVQSLAGRMVQHNNPRPVAELKKENEIPPKKEIPLKKENEIPPETEIPLKKENKIPPNKDQQHGKINLLHVLKYLIEYLNKYFNDFLETIDEKVTTRC